MIKDVMRRGWDEMSDFFQGNGADVLFRGEGTEVNERGWALEMNCAVCGAALVAPWPYVACSVMDAEIRGDAMEILYSDCWFTLCSSCSESYDLQSFRPCVRKDPLILPAAEVVDPGDWLERLASPEEVMALDSFRYGDEEQDDREVVYYTECTMCGGFIYEKTPFKLFDVSVETRLSDDMSHLEERILTLEMCSDCAANVDFRSLTVWNKEKKVHEIHHFETLFPEGSGQVAVMIVT